jgi:hypothetical protein
VKWLGRDLFLIHLHTTQFAGSLHPAVTGRIEKHLNYYEDRLSGYRKELRNELAIARLRLLGIQVTETGTQVRASPVGRVLMYSRSKVAALLPILHAAPVAPARIATYS